MTQVTNPDAQSAGPPVQLQEVFVLSGFPTHTFVQPQEYVRLLVALRTAGRSVVVEGPSGIGKTTAVTNAMAEAGLTNVLPLSARSKGDLATIAELPNLRPLGTVVIDDFHRLTDGVKRDIADLMKALADEGARDSKLVVIGITNAGQSLISFGRDLANRIEVIPFETNPEHRVEELLVKGEQALNCELNVRGDIVADAHGSFYLAQMLAYHTCLRAGLLEARAVKQVTVESYHAIKTVVMEQLSRSFHDTAVSFARGTKLKLTRFRGHLILEGKESADGKNQTAVRSGVQAADRRSGDGRAHAGRAVARVRSLRTEHHRLGRQGGR